MTPEHERLGGRGYCVKEEPVLIGMEIDPDPDPDLDCNSRRWSDT